MPNKMYIKGRKAEYKEIARLRAQGYDHVGRTAGSHGVFDVFAIKIYDQSNDLKVKGSIKLVQLKTGESAERERAKARAEIEKLTGLFSVEGVVA